MGLSCWLSGKECACQFRIHRRHEFHPWVRKIPCRGNGNPLQWSQLKVFPGKSHGQWSLTGYSPWGQKESRHLATQQQWCSGCGPFPCLIPSLLPVEAFSWYPGTSLPTIPPHPPVLQQKLPLVALSEQLNTMLDAALWNPEGRYWPKDGY